jgi:two-component sensor histidine kinase
MADADARVQPTYSGAADPVAPQSGRAFAKLMLVILGVQLLQMLPRVFPEAGDPQWDRLILVLLNLLPNFPGCVWVWWYAQRDRWAISLPFGSLLYHVVGCLVFVATSAICGLLARTAVQGPELAEQTMRWIPYWVSVFASTPIWYTLFYIVARFTREQRRSWDAARVAESEERARHQADALRASAELRMLRTYVQPHFLFNALNAIASLIDVAPAKARDAVVMTSDLLRSALIDDTTAVDLVPLRDELATARQYLEIERLRMEERLVVVEDIADAATLTLVPRFTLQTLVENAVRHGLFPSRQGGTVSIHARCDERALHLTVRDTGVGSDAAAVTASPGFGLRSLRERLRLLFGALAQVAIDTSPGGGFSVTVTVPAAADDMECASTTVPTRAPLTRTP